MRFVGLPNVSPTYRANIITGIVVVGVSIYIDKKIQKNEAYQTQLLDNWRDSIVYSFDADGNRIATVALDDGEKIGVIVGTALNSEYDPSVDPSTSDFTTDHIPEAGSVAAAGDPPPPDDEDPKTDSEGSPLGSRGVKTDPKTLESNGKVGDRNYWKIDIENPAPGKRPGQAHIQFGGRGSHHNIYNFKTGKFDGLSKTQNKKLLSDPKVQRAITKAIEFLKP